MMTCRNAVLALVLLCSVFPARSQKTDTDTRQTQIVHRIGFLGAESGPYDQTALRDLRANLQNLGYVEGRNLVIETRLAEGAYQRLPELAAELVALKVEVLVTDGVKATLGAHRATTIVPIVAGNIGDAIDTGLVKSYAKPGGNVTGVSALAPETMTKRLELLKSADPRIARVAVLVNPDNPLFDRYLRDLRAMALGLKITIEPVVVNGAAALDAAFLTIAEKRADAVIVHGDTLFVTNVGKIAALIGRQRIPSAGWSSAANSGLLIGYGFESSETRPYLAAYVDRILKGEKPGELPVRQPTKFRLAINLQTAKALGLTIPQTLLLRADDVIR